MKIFKLLGVNFALAMLLAACGGGPNNTLTAPSSGVVQYTTPTSIVATTNSTAILSDGSTSATITVLALDANHVLLTNSQISFAASSGTLKVTNALTNANGQAQATLTAIGSSASSITVTATAGKLTTTVDVQVIPAQPPTVAAVSLVSDTQAILSDGTTAAKLTAFVKDANGNLLPNIAVAFSASSGGIAPVAANSTTTDASGSATAVLSTAGDPSLRTITVTATVGGFAAQVQVAVVNPVKAASLSISASPATVLPGDTVAITVIALDSNNVALANVPVAVATSSGVLSIPAVATTGTNGAFVDTLTVPSDAGGSSITVTASSGNLTASTQITVTRTTSIVATTNTTAILSDGSTSATITVLALDANHVLLANVPVSFAASSGTLKVTNALTNANGQAQATLTAIGSSAGSITVTATSGNLTSTVDVQVIPAAKPSTVAAVSLVSDTRAILSDGSTTAKLTAFVKDTNGNLMSNIPVAFSASSGGVAPVSANSTTTGPSGSATAVLSTAGDPSLRTITVTATVGSFSAQVQVAVVDSAKAASLSISAKPTTVLPGDTVAITVVALDSNNVAVANVPVTVATSAGVLSIPAAASTGANGTFIDTLTVPSDAGGSSITVTATSGNLTASTQITVTGPITASSIAVNSSASAILQNGTTSATITAIALDSNHNLLANVPITLSASSGALLVNRTTTDATGTVTATLSTGGDPSLRTITVTAISGGLTASTAVEVIATGSASPVAALSLSASPTSILSDGSTPSTITAYARDASNNLLANVPVVFTASSGGIVANGTSVTGAVGTVTAQLNTAADPTIRTIVVRATAGIISATLNVPVVAANTSLGVQMGSGQVVGAAVSNFAAGIIGLSAPAISPTGTTTLQVVLESGGQLYTQPTTVYFSSTCLDLTSNPSVISGTGVSGTTALTSTGLVLATYTPGAACFGRSDTITARATIGGQTLTATNVVAISAAGGISLVTAPPAILAISDVNTQGYTPAQPKSAPIKFLVTDGSGAPLVGQSVTLNWALQPYVNVGYGGAPAVAPTLSCGTPPCTLTTDSSGTVSVTLTSGSGPMAGTQVNITANTLVAGVPASAETGIFYIGTGIPSAAKVGINLQCPNIEAGFSGSANSTNSAALTALGVIMADRYNYPVPAGTLVSFSAEGGTLSRSSCVTSNANGVSSCSVNWQPKGVFPTFDTNLGICSALPVTAGTCDRNGRASILATVVGEETLNDPTNPEPGQLVYQNWQLLGDAFRDDNENGAFTTGEYYFDSTFASPSKAAFEAVGVLGGARYIGALCNNNGVCASLPVLGLGAQQIIVMSGSTPDGTQPSTSPTYTLSAAQAQSAGFQFTLADANLNPLPAGTTITASVGDSQLVVNPGTRTFTVPCETEPNTISVSVVGSSAITSTVVSTLKLLVTSPLGVSTTLTYTVNVTP